MIIADLEYMTELSDSSSTVGGRKSKKFALLKNVFAQQINTNLTIQVAVLNGYVFQGNSTDQSNNIEVN